MYAVVSAAKSPRRFGDCVVLAVESTVDSDESTGAVDRSPTAHGLASDCEGRA